MKNLFTVLFSALILASCHKDPPAPPDPGDEFCGVASFLSKSGKMTHSFEYGADQQLTKAITYDTANGHIDYYAEYSYGSLQIFRNYFEGDGSPAYTAIYHLNAQGLPGMKTAVLPFRNDTTWFEYDYDGYLTRSVRKMWDGSYDTLYYSYSDGKRTRVLKPNIFPAVDTIKYEYYNFELPPNTYALMNSEYESSSDPAENELLLGKNTRLAVKSKIFRYMNDPYHILHYQYFYDFDADSNLTKIRGSVGYLNSYTLHSYELNVKVECN